MILVLIILLLPLQLFGTTYYVRTDGNDNNCNGTANVADSAGARPNCAELTISAGVAHATVPDDIVHIVAGTYNETVTNFVSGTPGHTIVIEGEGILGVNTIWRRTGAGKDNLTGGIGYLHNVAYIKFRNIKFDGTDAKATIYGLSDTATGLKGIEIRNCTFSNNGNRGVDLDGTTGIARTIYFNVVSTNPNQNHVIDGNFFSANKGISVHMIRTNNSQITNNEFANLQASQYTVPTNNGTYNAEAIHFGTGGSGNSLSDNYIHDFAKDAYIPGSGTSCRGGGGTTCQYTPSAIKFDSGINSNTLARNRIFNIDAAADDTGMGIYLESGVNNNNLLNNIIANVSKDGIHHGSPGTGPETGNVDDGNVLYNCGCAGINYSNATSGSVKNNIIYVIGSGPSGIRDSDITSGITYQNNLYFRTAGTNMNGWNLASSICTPNVTYSVWKDSSHTNEPGSVNADPVFVTNGLDFHLQAGSPAIHAGVGGIDMGAYPLVTPPIPVSITIVSANGGEVIATGSSYNITWNTNDTGTSKIEESFDSGATFPTVVVASTSSANQSYTWSVGPQASPTCRFRITSLLDGAVTDVSDQDFVTVGQYLK